MKKSCRECTSKASPRPLFNFDKYPIQPLNARNSFKTGLSKSHKKGNFCFPFEPSPF